MRSLGEYELIGETRDDAAGEAFDKVARFLGLGYPGGPAIQKAAAQGQAGKIHLPRVFLDRQDYEFSFSGLKTATMNEWNKLKRRGTIDVNDLAAEFQDALVEVLVEKTIHAANQYQVCSILLAGGVAANQHLRNLLKIKSQELGLPLYYPRLQLCTDNAAMIAGNAYISYVRGDFAPLNINAYPGI